MNTLEEQFKQLLRESKDRLDFEQAAEDLRTVMEAVEGDGTLLPLTKRQMQNLASTALFALEQRRESADELERALLSVSANTTTLEEPTAGLLAEWFYHVTYRGHEVGDEAVAVASQIISRRQPNQGENTKKLRDALMRYEWLAAYGTNPTLSCNNARGLQMATRVQPLPAGIAAELHAGAQRTFEMGQKRSHKSRAELCQDSLEHCSKLIGDSWAAHQADPSKFMEQTPSFCVRVCLGDIRQIVGECPELADDAEALSSEIETLVARFETVAYRSSSTVFNAYKREMESVDLLIEQTIEFASLRDQLKELQRRVDDSVRRGRQGLDQLGRFHGGQAAALISTLFEKLKGKRSSAEQLHLKLREVSEQIENLEKMPDAPAASTIRRGQTMVAEDSALVRWIDDFPKREEKRKAFDIIHDLRRRLDHLWRKMKAAEAARAEAFAKQCSHLVEAIAASQEAPRLLGEISDLRRSLYEEFPNAIAKRLETEVDRVFAAFRQRLSDPQPLRLQIQAIQDDVDRAHSRIFTPVDFEALFKRVGQCRHWASLRDFPQEHRAAVSKEVKRCYAEVHKLRSRQTRVMADRESRAAELFTELDLDIREGSASAIAKPGDPAEWDALVGLDRRLRDAERLLKDDQRSALRALLDQGFQAVRGARNAFALESGRRFASYNEILSALQASLEESPTRETALEAIAQLKPLRAELREDRGLLGRHRSEIYSLLDMVSQGVDEAFERANVQSAGLAAQIRSDIERLEQAASAAVDWNAVYALIALHKEQSAVVRDARLSITDRKELRQRLEVVWLPISEKLQQYRFSRTQREDLDTLMRRLEQQGLLLFVRDYPKAA